MTLSVKRVSGKAIEDYLDDLAHLRITVFRAFPYLYEGSAEYEKKYLQTYIDSDDSVIVLVIDGDNVVGASTGLPLEDETPEFRQPFEQANYNIATIFYNGESVLLPEYRGRGLGKRFFQEREAHAKSLNCFNAICFCAVDRPVDHPRRPADYQPLDTFWQSQGYKKQPDLKTAISWQDLDEDHETAKPMTFWLKPL